MNDNRTIFKKIIDGDIPATLVFEDERCLAFRDVAPVAPTHILVIPRKEIRSLATATTEDQAVLGHILLVIGQIARDQGLADSGYRVVTNIGDEGGQSVPHLHFHLLAGRQMKWPPG
jgi:histidine triad (HIT) family protein